MPNSGGISPVNWLSVEVAQLRRYLPGQLVIQQVGCPDPPAQLVLAQLAQGGISPLNWFAEVSRLARLPTPAVSHRSTGYRSNCQSAQLRRYLPGQLVIVEVQISQVGEVAQLRRYLPAQTGMGKERIIETSLILRGNRRRTQKPSNRSRVRRSKDKHTRECRQFKNIGLQASVSVIPAKAGTQNPVAGKYGIAANGLWIPAKAGMTVNMTTLPTENRPESTSAIPESAAPRKSGKLGRTNPAHEQKTAQPVGADQRQLVLPVATTIFAGHMW